MEQTSVRVEIGAIKDIAKRGWFVGHFMDRPEWAHTDDVEIKFGDHPAGTHKSGYGVNKVAQTMTVVVSGTVKYFWRLDGVEYSKIVEGDGTYIHFPPGVPHRWEVTEHVKSVTVRWPSVPDDQETVD